MKSVVVIGGGISGLASAALLAHAGHQVVLLERQDSLGGRAGSLTAEDFRFDLGPSWFLMPEVYEHFFNLLGTTTAAELQLTTLDPSYQIFAESPTHAVQPATRLVLPHGEAAAVEFFEALEPGSGTALKKYLASAEAAKELALKHFLYNPFTRPGSVLHHEVLRRFPTLIKLLGTPLSKFVEKRFRHPHLRQILQYPAVFLGTSPYQAPAIYHLMSELDLKSGVLYPQGGFIEIVNRLTEIAVAAGVKIRTGTSATEILTQPKGKSHRVLGVRYQNREGTEFTASADTVISAADLHHTETELLPPHLQTYPARWWHQRKSGPGAVLVLLGVSGKLPQLTHHSLVFTQDWHNNFAAVFDRQQSLPDPASFYVCKPSASDPAVAPAEHENLFMLVPTPADLSLGKGGFNGTGSPEVERIANSAIDTLAMWADIPDLRDRIVYRNTIGPEDFAANYNSWQGGMLGPAHILRQSAMFRARNFSRKVSGLYYAGATTSPGVGVPMCLISAEIVLKLIQGDHSSGPLPNTPLRSRRG